MPCEASPMPLQGSTASCMSVMPLRTFGALSKTFRANKPGCLCRS